jgi:uncharacterized damage-inducible protein DinB
MNVRYPSFTGTALAAAALTIVLAGPLEARQHAHHSMEVPETGLRAEFIRDVDQLERKYLGLAEAMAGRYDWRPGEGVRSVSEVLMHVAAANFMIPTTIGIDPPPPERLPAADMRAMEAVSDQAEVKAALEHSFRHLRHAIARTPDEALDDAVMLFGRSATKRGTLLLIVTHMHEHLGQLVAYARTNGVTPPWSAAGEE